MTIFDSPALPAFYDPPEPLAISTPLSEFLKSLNQGLADIHARREIIAGERIGYGDNVKQFVCDSIHDFPALAAKILEGGKSIRFCELPLPNRCISVQSHRLHEVTARYIVDYYIATDGLIGRWDFLVEYL